MGISIVTFKRHIKAGKVTARREEMAKGWRWLIEVSDVDERGAVPDEGWRNLIAHLESQVEWYQGQLATRDREVAELHVLLQRSQEKPHLLPPPREYQPERSPAASVVSSPETRHNVPTQSTKSFWKRVFG